MGHPLAILISDGINVTAAKVLQRRPAQFSCPVKIYVVALVCPMDGLWTITTIAQEASGKFPKNALALVRSNSHRRPQTIKFAKTHIADNEMSNVNFVVSDIS